MISAAKRLWQTLLTPTKGDAYVWLTIGLSHLILGAAFSWCWFVALPAYLFKESHDVRKGGGILDSTVDTLMFTVGLFYTGPIWWPIASLVTVVVGAIIREYKINGKQNQQVW